MGSELVSVGVVDGATSSSAYDETRRSLLAKAGLLAGGIGVASAIRAKEASATHLAGQQPEPQDFDGYYNIKHFGAQSGPAADPVANRTAIQSCITAAAADNKAVYVPPGTYLVHYREDTRLALPSNSVVIGHGVLSILKAGVASGETQPKPAGPLLSNVDKVNGNSDIRIENLVLDGNRAEADNTALIRFSATAPNFCERIFVRGVEGRNAGGTPPSSSNGTFFAFTFGRTRASIIQDCHVHDCDQDGINCLGGEDIVVAGNLVERCQDDHIVANADRITVVGNVCDARTTAGGGAIALRGGRWVTLVGNVCRGGAQAGIVVGGAGTGPTDPRRDILVKDNVVVEGGVGTSGLSFGANGQSGILLFNSAPNYLNRLERVSVSDNVIVAPINHGVAVSALSADMSEITISDNVIAMANDATREGSGVNCVNPTSDVSDVRVSGNAVKGARGHGIRLIGARLKRWDVQGNRVLDSGIGTASADQRSGIVVNSVQSASVIGNRAEDTRATGNKTQNYGLNVYLPTGDLVIAGNTLTNNAGSVFGGTVTLAQAGAVGTARLRIRDNPGFNPWSGEKALSGPWSQFQPVPGGPSFWTRSETVTFDIHFPANQTPRISVATRSVGFCAAADPGTPATSNTGFTLYVWVPVATLQPPPSNTIFVSWIAEPAV